MSKILVFGNPSPVTVVRSESEDGSIKEERVPFALPDGASETTTRVEFPDDWSTLEAYTALASSGGVFQAHINGNPSWVSSSDPLLAELLQSDLGVSVRPFEESN